MAQDFDLSRIRNIGIIAHIDAGKTTLTERFLFYSGKTHKYGSIDSGNTVMDYLDEERHRGITIVAAAASFNWTQNAKKHLIHLIDTPGHIDFTAEVERSLRVTDGAVVIFSGVEGVEAQSEKVWRQSSHYGLPRIAFVNKLDRLGASFPKVVDEIAEKFPEITTVPLHFPVGSESSFCGFIDLVTMQFLNTEDLEGAVKVEAIPDDLYSEATNVRERLIATLADFSDEIAELFLEGEPVDASLIKQVLRELVITNKVCPILLGSAKKNIGIYSLLDAVVDYLPSPADCVAYPAVRAKTEVAEIVHNTDSAFCGLVFKIIANDSADLLYVRIYSGKVKVNDVLINTRTGEKVKIKRILRLYANDISALDCAGAGDIVGIMGPSNTVTGDALCAVQRQLVLEKIDFPDPVIALAIEAKHSKDKVRFNNALAMISREDPTLKVEKNPHTGQLTIAGMGELHLDISVKRLSNEFHVETRYGKPRVAFRETIISDAILTGTFQKALGGCDLQAEVVLAFETLDEGWGVEIINEVLDQNDSHIKNWIRAALETLDAALKTGGNAGYPLIGVKATLKEVHGEKDKTTDGAIAGAVLDGVNKLVIMGTNVLEPIMHLSINSPEKATGEITTYLQARRAVIHEIVNIPNGKMLHCEVPLAEMFGFSSALPQLSGGRASFSMAPFGYQIISDADLAKLD